MALHTLEMLNYIKVSFNNRRYGPSFVSKGCNFILLLRGLIKTTQDDFLLGQLLQGLLVTFSLQRKYDNTIY